MANRRRPLVEAKTLTLRERDFSAQQRRDMAKAGEAMPDGSFPIANTSDLANAVSAVGRASNSATARRHIVKRARALGAVDKLPKSWNVKEAIADAGATITTDDSYEELIDDLEDAAEALLHLPFLTVMATFADHVIVGAPPYSNANGDEDPQFWDIPYTLDADGNPQLGEPTAVDPSFTISSDSMMESGTARIREAVGKTLIEAVAGSEGREWDVLLIQAGLSANGRYYPAAVLQAAVALFEGADAYADHSTSERSIRDWVGRFTDVKFGEWPVGKRMVEGLHAHFTVVTPWLREMLVEAVGAGISDPLGLSINASGTGGPRQMNGKTVLYVESITKVDSVDVVAQPAAGGAFLRLVASDRGDGGNTMELTPEQLTDLIAKAVDDKLTAQAEAARVVAEEAATTQAAADAEATRVAAEAATQAAETATQTPELAAVQESVRKMEALSESMRRRESGIRLREALTKAPISEHGKRLIESAYVELIERRDFEDTELALRIKETQEYEAALTGRDGAGNVTGLGGGRINVGDGQRDRLDKALQAFWEGKAVDGVEPMNMNKLYCLWTGTESWDFDARTMHADFTNFGDQHGYDSHLHHKKLRESLTTASWGSVFADNLYIRMMKEYSAAPYQAWRSIVSDIDPAPDFQTRHWSRLGGYADLAAVAQSATYPQLVSPLNEEVTYAISKRGGIDDMTFEMIVGDRFDRIRRLPSEMGLAAARTLQKFVLNMATTDNPTMAYDTVALYNSAHANTSASGNGLSLAGLAFVTQSMRGQTRYATVQEFLGERNLPKTLIVPAALQQRANRIVNPSDSYFINMPDSATANVGDSGTAIDPQAFKGQGINVLTYDVLTDATDWFAVADPAQVATIVIGFLGGNQDPELFMQDQPNVGANFSADKVSTKIRHIYGGVVEDHRSFFRSVVA